MTPSLLSQLEAQGVRLEAKLVFKSDQPLDSATVTLLRENKAALMADLITGPYGLEQAAKDRLAYYRDSYGLMQADAWLEQARAAHARAVATFPPHRQEHALRHYLERYCIGMSPQVIAVHTVALDLLAQVWLRYPPGLCLEAACKACGVVIDELPQNEG